MDTPNLNDSKTVPEIARDDIFEIYDRATRGEISFGEARTQMNEVEKMCIAVGDGWFDRYGAPPAELDELYEGRDRYWEHDFKDR